MTRLRDYLRCWLSDGCYDERVFEASLQELFGDRRRLFDADPSHTSRAKIAVTATTISNATPFIFSNYNGVGKRDNSCGT